MLEKLKKNLFVVNKEKKEEIATKIVINEGIKEIDPLRKRLFDITEANKQVIGTKTNAYIPMECLEVPDFQREDTLDPKKVQWLIDHWDSMMQEPLLVSVHKETCTYIILNGLHRYLAMLALGFTSVECVIVDIEEDRERKEIELFIGQQDGIDRMKPQDKHKGLVKLGDPAAVALDNAVNNTKGVDFKHNKSRGKGKAGELTNYDKAYFVAKNGMIQDVLDVLVAAKWNETSGGLGGRALMMVYDVLSTYNTPEVKAEIAKVLVKYKPNKFYGYARFAYHLRTESVAYDLYLEDWICYKLGIKRLIDDDNRIVDPIKIEEEYNRTHKKTA